MSNRIPVPPTAARPPVSPRPSPFSGADPQEMQRLAREQFSRLMAQAEHYLSSHPKACLGIGLSVGVLLGWLIKRR